jgi:hypothetical protein
VSNRSLIQREGLVHKRNKRVIYSAWGWRAARQSRSGFTSGCASCWNFNKYPPQGLTATFLGQIGRWPNKTLPQQL